MNAMDAPIKVNNNNSFESMGDEFPTEPQTPGEEDEDQDQVVNFASFLQESQELLELLKNLKDITTPQLNEKSKRIVDILQKYQEQSQLLDTHLETIVTTLINYIRPHIDAVYGQAKNQPTSNQAQDPHFVLTVFKLIYHVTKVRGYKTVSKFFPHEVVDLERTFYYLEQQIATDFATWEVRYVLLLWLSIIILVPFDLKIIDSSAENQQTLAARMIKEAKTYLRDSGKSREAAALFLAKLLTRPDMDTELVDFLTWANQTLIDATDHYMISGVYESLVGIFQVGDRNKLLSKIGLIYDSAIKPVTSITNKKLSLKLIQRIGLTFLPPRTPKWRYVKRSSSLLQNLTNVKDNAQNQEEDEEEDYDIPDQIETIIELLLTGLKDRDTVIRWSAAKGLGRISNRIPLNLAEDVIKFILELYAPGSTDSAWHGASLAIAEQARRGLLLPEQLPGLIPLLVSALNYDEKRGAHSKGANVRDAGCYVAWALARGYEPDILRDHLQLTLASSLLIVALYDREINCRRAAAAAFQEHVGRQGTFPHGIDIITTADYFSLSNRTEAYLKISPKIAEYPEYRNAMIGHMVNVKLEHWDQSIRELTAKTLHNLTLVDPKLMVETYLPELIPKTINNDINMRHGSILAIAEIIFALAKLQEENKAVELSAEMQHRIREIVPSIEKARLYRGRGAELIRFAVCKLLESISAANIPLNISDADRAALAAKTQPATDTKSKLPPIPRKEKSYIQQYLETLEENLKHPQEFVQESAVVALSAIYNRYFADVTPAKITQILDTYLKVLATDPNPASRRGYSLMLGYMPKQFYAPHEGVIAKDKPATKIFYLPNVVAALISATKIEEDPEKRDPETRRNAVHSMIHLISIVGLNETWTEKELISSMYLAMLECLNDYSIDNRGDVGSWVREAALKALKKFIDLLLAHDSESENKFLTATMVEEYLLRLVRQSVEKLDKIRSISCGIVEGLLGLAKKGNSSGSDTQTSVQSQTFKYHVTLTEIEQFDNCFAHEVPFIPNKEEFIALIQKEVRESRDWLDTSLTFKVFVPLLQYDFYRNSLLTGLVYSMGGVNNTKSLIQDSSTNTLEFFRGLKTRDDGVALAEKIAASFIQVLKDNENDDRVVVSLLRTLEFLLLNDAFALVNNENSQFAQSIYSLTFNTVKASKDVNRLLAAAGIFAGLLLFKAVRTQAITRLLSYLGHSFPKIRKTAAEQFYLQLEITEGLIDASKVEEVKDILLTTQWIEKTELSKPRRMTLYDIIGIPRPVLVSQAQAAANNTKTE